MATDITSVRTTLDALLEDPAGPRVTIVMPIDHDLRSDSVRIRNLVKQVEASAQEAPGRPDVSDLIADLPDIVDDAHPVPHHYGGMAVFSDGNGQHLVALHLVPGAETHVGSEFQVIPLIGEIDPARCFLLTISRGGSALWRGSSHDIEPVDLEGAPTALAEVTWYRDLETQLQLHRTGGRSATFHGQGVDENTELEPLRTYMRGIDEVVEKQVGASEPLMIIGPGRLPAIYREVSRHQSFLPAGESHPDGMDRERLTALASATVEDLAVERTAGLLEKVGDLSSTGRSSTEPGAVARAASEGRIDTLLVDPTTWDPGVNDAVIATWRHGGTVLPIVGDPARLAAIHRW